MVPTHVITLEVVALHELKAIGWRGAFGVRATCRRFTAGRLVARQGASSAGFCEGDASCRLDGDKSPAESGDESPHSKC